MITRFERKIERRSGPKRSIETNDSRISVSLWNGNEIEPIGKKSKTWEVGIYFGSFFSISLMQKMKIYEYNTNVIRIYFYYYCLFYYYVFLLLLNYWIFLLFHVIIIHIIICIHMKIHIKICEYVSLDIIKYFKIFQIIL